MNSAASAARMAGGVGGGLTDESLTAAGAQAQATAEEALA